MSQVTHQAEANVDQPQLHEVGDAGTHTKEEPSNQEPEWRSYIRRDVPHGRRKKFKKRAQAVRKNHAGPDRILTIVDIKQNINDGQIVYSVEDSNGRLVTEVGSEGPEWIPEGDLDVWD